MKKQTYVHIGLILVATVVAAIGADQIPAAAPMTTDLAGRMGRIALSSVFRVFCPTVRSGGTGFAHKSGKIITAAHVVQGRQPSEVVLIRSTGDTTSVTKIVLDSDLDLAILYPSAAITGPTLPLSENDDITIGAQVSTWGFPSGYNGRAPLLASGCVAGSDFVRVDNGKLVPRLVVNAAFNLGNSGGPLIDLAKNTVVGVVSSKLAPLPPEIESALNALKSQQAGTGFMREKPDGTSEKLVEAQVVEMVLQYLRSQTQLVIGHAVLPQQLRGFLKRNGIDP